ncbi:flagellar FliJ protein [Anaerobacterium chartisolvens]|uniref:Flagellar FliJ protein n=1 Tax=Anaerobacterium chartisolvens TaxID=1297424 RepID=A0A369B756_9FIRM|nr:flagellar export protein FliJ [Anaerobacterium chartisolvens]RCX15514.1 flagellar FliJ protein [Anaerobacterium chartisolvens]
MAKFTFGLQSVLNLKIQMEDSLKNELAKAIRKLERERELLNKIEFEREQLIGQMCCESSKGIRVSSLKEYGGYISFLVQKAQIQKENINYARGNVDRYRDQLIKAVQEKEMLEKLKEKKYEEYSAEQLREEQNTNDEIISYNYNRVMAGEKNGYKK